MSIFTPEIPGWIFSMLFFQKSDIADTRKLEGKFFPKPAKMFPVTKIPRKVASMKRLTLLFAMAGFAILSAQSFSFADDELLSPLFLRQNRSSPWVYGAHIETGLYVNQYGQKNTYTGNTDWPGGPDDWSGNTILNQNTQQSDWQMNQAWVYFGKELNTRCGWDLGGRVDFLYGTDARYAQSAGLEKDAGHGYWGSGDYYSALGQMYAEVGYGRLSAMVGKFFSPLGHESLNATERFFYSLSKSYGVAPDTNTGVLATWQATDRFSIFGGWVQGANQFCDTSRDNSLVSGFEYDLCDHTTLGYALQVGSNTRDDFDYFYHSLYLTHELNDRWEYTFEWSLANEKTSGLKHGIYGIDQALYYRLNCRWVLGLRLEWMHDYEAGDSNDMYGITLGANWKPRPWLLVRPEVRYDKMHGGGMPFNQTKSFGLDPKSEQFSGGFSTVVRF